MKQLFKSLQLLEPPVKPPFIILAVGSVAGLIGSFLVQYPLILSIPYGAAICVSIYNTVFFLKYKRKKLAILDLLMISIQIGSILGLLFKMQRIKHLLLIGYAFHKIVLEVALFILSECTTCSSVLIWLQLLVKIYKTKKNDNIAP